MNTVYLFFLLINYLIPSNHYNDVSTEAALPGWDKAFVYVPLFTGVSLLAVMSVPDGRRKLKTRWEVFTSPNHASPLNEGAFHFTSFQHEKAQETQADKGVHFSTAFMMYRPMYIFYQYLLNGLYKVISPSRMSMHVTHTAKYAALVTDFLFGLNEEYVDGFEKDEGFSMYDMTANISGLIFSVLRDNHMLGHLYVHFNVHRPSPAWKYHFWLCMPSYEFTAYYDLSYLLDRTDKKSRFIREYSDVFPYDPFLKKLSGQHTPEICCEHQRIK